MTDEEIRQLRLLRDESQDDGWADWFGQNERKFYEEAWKSIPRLLDIAAAARDAADALTMLQSRLKRLPEVGEGGQTIGESLGRAQVVALMTAADEGKITSAATQLQSALAAEGGAK